MTPTHHTRGLLALGLLLTGPGREIFCGGFTRLLDRGFGEGDHPVHGLDGRVEALDQDLAGLDSPETPEIPETSLPLNLDGRVLTEFLDRLARRSHRGSELIQTGR